MKWFSECVALTFSLQSLRMLNDLTKSNKSKVFCFVFSISLLFYLSQLYILNSRKCANGPNRPASQPSIHSFQSICLHAVTHTNHSLEIKYEFSPSPIKTDHVTVFNLSSNSIIYLFISLLAGGWRRRWRDVNRSLYYFVTCMLSKISVYAQQVCKSLWPMKLFSNDSNKML